MWDADVHRLRPGEDYTIDVQVTNCQVRIKGSVVLQEKCLPKCLLLKELPVLCHVQ